MYIRNSCVHVLVLSFFCLQVRNYSVMTIYNRK
uniref:Uncharacterized protein n=1 Tax=Anguilla anguilla TaxID=7936 RepID=A0A0E9XRD6_ANGAN